MGSREKRVEEPTDLFGRVAAKLKPGRAAISEKRVMSAGRLHGWRSCWDGTTGLIVVCHVMPRAMLSADDDLWHHSPEGH